MPRRCKAQRQSGVGSVRRAASVDGCAHQTGVSVMHVQGLSDFSTRWQDIDKTQCDERDVWMGSFV
jgi:hypothetical protein